MRLLDLEDQMIEVVWPTDVSDVPYQMALYVNSILRWYIDKYGFDVAFRQRTIFRLEN
jgi:hypothetical protein